MKLERITAVCIVIVIMLSLTACSSSSTTKSKDKSTDLSKLEVGQEDVTFGNYTWKVLEIKDDTALLITNEIVDTGSFNDEYEAIDWSGSSLRKYLNDPFLRENFTEDEQGKIVQVMNTTPDNAWFYTSGGGNTLDRIFLLSIEEVLKYFGDSGQLESKNPDSGDHVEDEYSEYNIDDEYNTERIARSDGTAAWWWLRSMGHTSKFAGAVTHSGRLEVGGYFVQEEFGIRPAIWVQMKNTQDDVVDQEEVVDEVVDVDDGEVVDEVVDDGAVLDQELVTDLANLAAGQDNVKFGNFVWRVLDVQDGKALLLTNDIVELRPYHKSCTKMTWADCDIRTYLNDPFIKLNFSEDEQVKIVETTIDNPDNEWFGTEGCEDTQDKVFLLSIAEVVKYFGDSGQFENGNPESEYFIDDEYNEDRIANFEGAAEWWFTRSPGAEDGRAADISDVGPLIVYGDCLNAGHGMRPALWVSMDEEEVADQELVTDLTNLAAGQDNVKFGNFVWRVLDVQDGQALLLTNDIVELRPYHKSCTKMTWADCDIRTYLNDPFIKLNFSEDEQIKIVETTINNPDNEWFGTEGCEDTQDKVFLLSIAEVVKYFGDSGQFENGNPESEYFIDDEYNEDRIANFEGAAEWWFTRSPGAEDGRAADISDVGPLIVYGDCLNAGHGMRPALWISKE
jgi:hypothetical protein